MTATSGHVDDNDGNSDGDAVREARTRMNGHDNNNGQHNDNEQDDGNGR